MENPFDNIDYEHENNTAHEYYMKGYLKGIQDGRDNVIKFFCKLSIEEILNWIYYYRYFYDKENKNENIL